MTTDDTAPREAAAASRHGWLSRNLPTSLNPVRARDHALDALRNGDHAAQAATDAAMQLARANPGFEIEVESPSALQLEARARAEASWRVVGNWLLLAIFASLIVLAVSFFVEDTSTFGGDYAPYFSALIWLLVVPWGLCQLLRLLMIAPWSRPKAEVRPQSDSTPGSSAGRSGVG